MVDFCFLLNIIGNYSSPIICAPGRQQLTYTFIYIVNKGSKFLGAQFTKRESLGEKGAGDPRCKNWITPFKVRSLRAVSLPWVIVQVFTEPCGK